LDKQIPHIERNASITVTDSRLNLDGTPIIVATHIAKGGELWGLRDDNRNPVWPLRNEDSGEGHR
jgi:hypothetical protein